MFASSRIVGSEDVVVEIKKWAVLLLGVLDDTIKKNILESELEKANADLIHPNKNRLFINLFYLALFFLKEPQLFDAMLERLQVFLKSVIILKYEEIDTKLFEIDNLHQLLQCAAIQSAMTVSLERTPVFSLVIKNKYSWLAVIKRINDIANQFNQMHNIIINLNPLLSVGTLLRDNIQDRDIFYISSLGAHITKEEVGHSPGIGTFLMEEACLQAIREKIPLRLMAEGDSCYFYAKFFERFFIKYYSDKIDKKLCEHICNAMWKAVDDEDAILELTYDELSGKSYSLCHRPDIASVFSANSLFTTVIYQLETIHQRKLACSNEQVRSSSPTR
jgi:hypothetical protein